MTRVHVRMGLQEFTFYRQSEIQRYIEISEAVVVSRRVRAGAHV